MLITRRSSLLGAFSLLGAKTGAAAESAAYPEFDRIVAELTPNLDMLQLGETSHFKALLSRQPLTRMPFWQNLKRGGYTDYYVEIPTAAQLPVRQLARGEIDTDSFSKQIKKLALEAYSRLNIPADQQVIYLNATNRHMQSTIPDILAAGRAGLSVHAIDPRGFEFRTRFRTRSMPELPGYQKVTQQETVSRDAETARSIQDTRTGKAALCYGSLHFTYHGNPGGPFIENISSAFQRLGVRTGTVLMAGDDLQNLKGWVDGQLNAPRFRRPHYIYCVEEDKSFRYQTPMAAMPNPGAPSL